MPDAAASPPKPKARKKPAKKPAPPKKDPLSLELASITQALRSLERKKDAAAVVAKAAEMCRGPFKAWSELKDLFARTVEIERLNAPPDGAAKAAARTLVEGEVDDNLEDAIDDGRIAVDESDAEDLQLLELTRAEIELFKRIAFSWLYREPQGEPRPTAEPPGSPGKVEAIRGRVAAKEQTFSPLDADLKGAVIVPRANGSGMHVLGRSEAG